MSVTMHSRSLVEASDGVLSCLTPYQHFAAPSHVET